MDIIAEAIKVLTLGTYSDINLLLSPSPNNTSTVLAMLIIVLKYALLATAIYAFTSRFTSSKNAVMVTAAALLVAVIITQPWTQGNEISSRISMLQNGFADNSEVKFNPTLLKSWPAKDVIGFTSAALGSVYNATSSLKSATTIKTPFMEIDWIYYVVLIIVSALAFYVLKTYSKLLAISVPAIMVMMLIGLPLQLVVAIILVIVLAVVAYYLQKLHPVLSIYPAVFAALVIISLISIPTNVLIALLMVLMFISLIPVFYLVGILLAGFGKVVEEREKLGMKIRPKKLIEETAGQWDPIAVAIILTALFVVVLAIFGANLYGIGTFVGLSVGLVRG